MSDNTKKERTTKLKELAPVPIQMIENDLEEEDANIWCKNASIGEYTVITGSNNQKFVVWTITIETAKNQRIIIRKRYNDFVKLRELLVSKYPNHIVEIPKLPSKSVLLNFESNFLAKRRNGLEFFTNSILLNPIFSHDPLVKQFIIE